MDAEHSESTINVGKGSIFQLQPAILELTKLNSKNKTDRGLNKYYLANVHASRDVQFDMSEEIKLLDSEQEQIRISTTVKIYGIGQNGSCELCATQSDENIDVQKRAVDQKNSEVRGKIAKKEKLLGKLNQEYINCTHELTTNEVVACDLREDPSLKKAKELVKLLQEKYEKM